MKRVAIQMAEKHLAAAKSSLELMQLSNGFEVYERGWSQFLTEASRIYSKLKEGAKGCPKSAAWINQKGLERKKDPLLKYIHHARNTDEHGIEYISSLSAENLMTSVKEGLGGYLSMKFMVDSQGRFHYRDVVAKDSEGNNLPVSLLNAQVLPLTAIDTKYGDKFEPPLMHLHRPIVDTSPRGLAILAIAYLSDILQEASELPQRL